jgi:predicted nucleotidyltransferase
MTIAPDAKIHVSDQELAIIRRILRESLTGEDVYVFGSRARGAHRKTSDIDLAISGSMPLHISTRSKLEFGFSESDLPLKVAVVDLLTADESFKRIVQADTIKLRYT